MFNKPASKSDLLITGLNLAAALNVIKFITITKWIWKHFIVWLKSDIDVSEAGLMF